LKNNYRVLIKIQINGEMAIANLPNRDNVCAVIITYQPDTEFIDRLNNILRQFVYAVIVDNASHNRSLSMLKSLTHNNAHIIFNEKNLGVAKALNQGVCWAKENNYEFVITLDQDSNPGEGFIKAICDIWSRLDNNKVAALGVNHIDGNTNKLYFEKGSLKNRTYTFRKTVITSGSFMNIQTFYQIGPFREEFFIDGIDHEFCLRAGSKGFKIVMILEPFLVHAIGKRKSHRFPFFKKISVESTNHDPQRWYFMTRNRIRLVMEYIFKDTWAISRAVRLMGSVVVMIMFEKSRLKKIRYIFLGIWDSLTANYNRVII
jgi:rhamnosyltransferase